VPSVLSHPAVPLALTAAAGARAIPPRLAVAACIASVLPDVDAIGYWAGIPYDSPLGHRGFTHSLFFALVVAVVAAAILSRRAIPAALALGVVFVAAASHGLLDAMTSGGRGIAFFSPFSNARFHLPWRPIRVSPIGVAPFFSARGLAVLKSELVWIWAPAAAFALLGVAIRSRRRDRLSGT
jgi:inner membrane protein